MTAELLIDLGALWLWAGAAVAAAFLVVGIDRIDDSAEGSYIFRPLLVPGILLIWPIVLWRWAALETNRDDWRLRHRPERRAHLLAWCLLAVLIPLIVVLGLSLRQSWPGDVAPIQLEAAG